MVELSGFFGVFFFTYNVEYDTAYHILQFANA